MPFARLTWTCGLLAAASLAGCGDKAPTDAMKPQKMALLAALRNADTAKFQNESAGKSDAVCGEVNAQNGLGGFTGFHRYVAKPQFYLIEGSTISTWDTADAKLLGVTAADVMRLEDQTQREGVDWIRRDFFNAVWKSYCS